MSPKPKPAYNSLSAAQLNSPLRHATFDFISWLLKLYIQFRFCVYIQGPSPKITAPGKGFVVASNHTSNWDPPMVAMAFPHVDLAFMAKQELMEMKFLGRLLYYCGTFAVNRTRMEKATLKTAKTILTESTWALGLFPEGTRQKDEQATGKVQELKKGVAVLAMVGKRPVCPVGLARGGPNNKHAAITVGEFLEAHADESSDAFAARIQQAMQACLQESEALLAKKLGLTL